MEVRRRGRRGRLAPLLALAVGAGPRPREELPRELPPVRREVAGRARVPLHLPAADGGDLPMITEPTPRREELYARPECPQPGRWSAPDGVATETDVSALLGALVRALKPDLVVETGSYLGHTTEAIGRALAAEARGGPICFEGVA